LPPDKGIHEIDGGNTRFDELIWSDSPCRIERLSLNRHQLTAQRRGFAVKRPKTPVENASHEHLSHGDPYDVSFEIHRTPRRIESHGSLEDLNRTIAFLYSKICPWRCPEGFHRDRFSVSRIPYPFDEKQRTHDIPNGPISFAIEWSHCRAQQSDHLGLVEYFGKSGAPFGHFEGKVFVILASQPDQLDTHARCRDLFEEKSLVDAVTYKKIHVPEKTQQIVLSRERTECVYRVEGILLQVYHTQEFREKEHPFVGFGKAIPPDKLHQIQRSFSLARVFPKKSFPLFPVLSQRPSK
jgi:hypothetical protein